MRRTPLLLAAVAAVMVVSVVPAAASPANSPKAEQYVLDCGSGGTVTVFGIQQSSGAALFEGDHKGRRYVVSGISFPDVSFELSFGIKKGYSTRLECVLVSPDLGLGPVFVTIASK